VTHDLVIRGDAFDVAVDDGVIAAVGPELPRGSEELDARRIAVVPGWVDAHVHFNEPGAYGGRLLTPTPGDSR
jgi:dihydroorotase-like cyclic amidohydrolase